MEEHEVSGLVVLREWQLKKISDSNPNHYGNDIGKINENTPQKNAGGFGLFSTAFNILWETPTVRADTVPRRDNQSGIYSRPIEYKPSGNNVTGLLELRGIVLLHSDQVIRSEMATILKLFIPNKLYTTEVAKDLYSRYQVPIVLTNDITQSLKQWRQLDGLWYLKQNEEIWDTLQVNGKEESDNLEHLWGVEDLPFVHQEKHEKLVITEPVMIGDKEIPPEELDAMFKKFLADKKMREYKRRKRRGG